MSKIKKFSEEKKNQVYKLQKNQITYLKFQKQIKTPKNYIGH